jgi:adenosylmethionine-8-amino-7-oxononanoate aminotransferase
MAAHRPILDLADRIAALAPGDLNRVWFVSGGSEATENAVKLARQYHVERGQPSRFKVISRWQSYHGGTLGALGYGGHTFRRRKYLPALNDQPKIPPAYRYRCAFCHDRSACNLECARALERTIRLEGPENVAAFIAEPVVGAALGAVPPPAGYFTAIREICDRYEVLFIADEVMTGFGRTGRMFAMEHWGVVPDIVAVAKGISGGYTPLGAVVAREHLIAQFERNGSNFVGGHTFTGNPLSCAVGLAVIDYLLAHDLVTQANSVGSYFLARLEALRSHPIVGDVRGMGMLVGLELVKNKETREPFPPEQRISARIGVEALERGLISYPGTGSVDGVEGDHILFGPPLIMTREQVDELVDILDRSISAVESTLG